MTLRLGGGLRKKTPTFYPGANPTTLEFAATTPSL
jgi:hypothetical protein